MFSKGLARLGNGIAVVVPHVPLWELTGALVPRPELFPSSFFEGGGGGLRKKKERERIGQRVFPESGSQRA